MRLGPGILVEIVPAGLRFLTTLPLQAPMLFPVEFDQEFEGREAKVGSKRVPFSAPGENEFLCKGMRQRRKVVSHSHLAAGLGCGVGTVAADSLTLNVGWMRETGVSRSAFHFDRCRTIYVFANNRAALLLANSPELLLGFFRAIAGTLNTKALTLLDAGGAREATMPLLTFYFDWCICVHVLSFHLSALLFACPAKFLLCFFWTLAGTLTAYTAAFLYVAWTRKTDMSHWASNFNFCLRIFIIANDRRALFLAGTPEILLGFFRREARTLTACPTALL